jgi:predicted MPP superfamily phosphohydrolase
MKEANKPTSSARRRFLKRAAVGAVIGLGTGTYAHEWEPDHPEVVHREVRLAGWPPSAAGLRIGQLSDLHCQSEAAVARTARAARLLLAQHPDVVFLTGDYISDRHGVGWAAGCADALAPLARAGLGVFAILGNHDWAGPERVLWELTRVGFTTLRNQSAALPGVTDVWLVGMDSRSQNAQNPIQALESVPGDAVKILLMHEPDYADEAPLGFALQVSGHSHGGQIRLPGLPLHCPEYGRKYPEGLRLAAHHPVYTTRGVGMMGPQMRFCCPPEVTVLTIRPAEVSQG